MLIPETQQRDFLIYAFRYTLGRATYAPHTVIAVLKNAWPELGSGDRALFKREIKEAVQADLAGYPCDKKAWMSILSLED